MLHKVSQETIELINDTYESYCSERFPNIADSDVRATYIYAAIAMYATSDYGTTLLADMDHMVETLDKYVAQLSVISEDNVGKTGSVAHIPFYRFTALVNRLVIPALFKAESRGYGYIEVVNNPKDANVVLMHHATDARPLCTVIDENFVIEPVNQITDLRDTSCEKVYYKIYITEEERDV